MLGVGRDPGIQVSTCEVRAMPCGDVLGIGRDP